MPIKRFDLNSSGCERRSPTGLYVLAAEHEAHLAEAARIIRKLLLEGQGESNTVQDAQKWLTGAAADKAPIVRRKRFKSDGGTGWCKHCNVHRSNHVFEGDDEFCKSADGRAPLTEDYPSVIEGLALTDDPKNETSTLLDRIAEREATRNVAERFSMDPLHVAHDIITHRLKVGDDSGWALNAAYAFADKLRSKPTVAPNPGLQEQESK